ncbi:MAG: hypothetical protein MZV64_21765 [Ignavibacteriales bacterium]|nr:hypothetical protein [Ignavibacteriales bacterium]
MKQLCFPYPKNPVIGKILCIRDRKNELHKKFEYAVDPENYFIKPERATEYKNFEVLNSGDPSGESLDIVIIPEGYTEDEMDTVQKRL